jgi:hypothetical protein
LELPIDHFRLLGISPASDAQTALQMLQQRLDRVPSDGYSSETLEARADLLRSSADLLSDSKRRARYEADLTALASGGGDVIAALDIASSLEVGGLLLLLEADQSLDCFELASRSLQPPRAPALGSSREADLTLVAAQACIAGANELQQQRRFEAAAQLLLQGQQLLQRMGQLPQLRQQLGDSLDALAPYRVLDLLSRPLTATSERQDGLRLLNELVQRRGGLEGSADPRLGSEEFLSFFKQIRAFLTVQEQVDLFSGWAENSAAADFLATTALTASGFVQRKPERIAAALGRLEVSSQADTEVLQACLLLLLGKVDLAQSCFSKGASPELQTWASQQSDDPLAQLCAYCSDWLKRDVLPGYRDLEADPDLDAYFADRDVQAFIEQNDPSPRSSSAGEAAARLNNPFAGYASGLGLSGALPEPLGEPALEFANLAAAASSTAIETDDLDDDDELEPWQAPWANWQLPALALPPLKPPQISWSSLRRPPVLAGLAVTTVVVVAAIAVTLRPPRRAVQPLSVQPAREQPAVAPAPQAAPKPANTLPLTSAEPTEAQLKTLLKAWLAAKAAVLAGRSSDVPLSDLARSTPIERLEAERSSDAARGETQTIETNISALEVVERSATRIATRVTLTYSDSRTSGGQVTARTPATTLINRYVFARDGQTWKLVAFGRSD